MFGIVGSKLLAEINITGSLRQVAETKQEEEIIMSSH